MAYYLSKVQLPDFGFSPDARFPVVNGEKVILPSICTLDIKMTVTLFSMILGVAYKKIVCQKRLRL